MMAMKVKYYDYDDNYDDKKNDADEEKWSSRIFCGQTKPASTLQAVLRNLEFVKNGQRN